MVKTWMQCSKTVKPILAPIDKETFCGWSEYLKISLPSTVMLCSEWWAFESITILAGIIGVTELACQTIVFSIAAFTC